MKEVLQAICDVLKGELEPGDSNPMARFVLCDDGSGHVDNGGGGRARFAWRDPDDCVKLLRTRSLQAAKDRVVEAAVGLVRVGDISGNALRMRALQDDLCKAVDDLNSFGAEHE